MGKTGFKLMNLSLVLISLTSLFGGIVYRFYALNSNGVILSLVLILIAFFIFLKSSKPKTLISDPPAINQNPSTSTNTKTYYLLFTVYCLLFVSCLFILFSHQTDKSIISPWQAVPNYFFALYGFLAILLFALILKSKERYKTLTMLTISLHYFLSFSVALIIYKIGYGYDSFVHEATLNLIDKIGSVEPKPFYYLGQYGLIIIIHKIFLIPISWLNKILVPLLASIYLPYYALASMKKWTGSENFKAKLLALASFLILPFSIFISTTPQNISYLFLVLIIFIGMGEINRFNLGLMYLLSLSSVITQPIAGVPALMFTLFLTIYSSTKITYKKISAAIIFLFSTITIPLAFYAMENGATIKLSKSLSFISPNITIPGQENFIYNFIYLLEMNKGMIFVALILAGMLAAFKRNNGQKLIPYLIISFSLFVSYILTKTFSFNYLINYERNDYPDRILLTAFLFLLPFIMMAIYEFTKKIILEKNSVKFPFLIFLAVLITSSLYLSYPRYDRYFNSKGFSTGKNDIRAVHQINDSAETDYIVLSNQQVSAAALKEFGFNRYYKSSSSNKISEEIFYYPVPTSGPLYNYYLDMVYKKPSRETMYAAMNLAGVKTGYFVLNKYWWAFPKILDEAKLSADKWWDAGDGEVYVFKFTNSQITRYKQ